MSFFLVNRHTTEVGSLARNELCCLARHHLSGPVRVPLRPSPSHLSISGFATWLFVSDRRRPCGVQVLRFVSIFACRRPYSGFPTGACSHCFPVDYGLRPRRRGSACIPLKADLSLCTRLSQQYASGVISHGAAAFIRTITACEFGRRHWLSLTSGETRPPQAIQDCRVGASSAAMLPPQRALYLFSQMGSC